MLIIPAIDLRGGRCVRLTQGRKETAKVYDRDPIEVAQSFAAAGARMLHVVDLDRAFAETESVNRTVLARIVRSVKIPVQFGGGVRSVTQAKEILDLGVERFVVGSLAVESSETLEEMLKLFGPRSVVVGIDAREGQVLVHGWQTNSSISALDLAKRVAEIGVQRIVYTDIARDGMMTGPNLDQSCQIAAAGVKVTVSGGVSSLEDLKRVGAVSSWGIDSVIVGKALYEERFTLTEALAAVAEV